MKRVGLRIGLLLALAATSVAKAATIYSDLDMNGGWGVPSLNGELGDQITAAGSDRFVTRLSIEIYSQGGPFPNPLGVPPGYADFQAQVYANDGVQGQPGSLLWQSLIVHVNYQPGLTLLNFDLSQVLVPDTFTWTLAYYNTSPIPPALPTALAPTIGSVDGFEWFRGPNGLWGHGPAFTYAAQIEAVPEPAVGVLLLAGIAVWHVRRKSSATIAD
jgi:hypothetical protein